MRYNGRDSTEYQRGRDLGFTIRDIAELDKLAFSKNVYSISYACNTGSETSDGSIFAQEWANHTGGTMKAVVDGQTSYESINITKLAYLYKYRAKKVEKRMVFLLLEV